uniref:G-protein coupled receptors family 1 profile domain-containing protein n=1 Tax=Panagrolaimus superbus TaxID=310955 RepID=A0A914YDK7_9BILA
MNGTSSAQIESVELCLSNMPDEFLPYFIFYMVGFGFIIPGFIIALCYIFLIRHLRNKNGKNMFVTAYTGRVVRSILKVVIFHFICWSPFWLFVILPILPKYFEEYDWSILLSPYVDKLRMSAR